MQRVSVATYSLWLAPPSLALTLVLKYRLVRPPLQTKHRHALLLSAEHPAQARRVRRQPGSSPGSTPRSRAHAMRSPLSDVAVE